MQIYPVNFTPSPETREFRFEIQAKKGAETAVCRIEEALEMVSDDNFEDSKSSWSIERRGAGTTWVVVHEGPVEKLTKVRVFATGSCGQVSQWLRIEPTGVAENPFEGDELGAKLAKLTDAQKSLYEMSKHYPLNPTLAPHDDFTALEQLELIEETGNGWVAVS